MVQEGWLSGNLQKKELNIGKRKEVYWTIAELVKNRLGKIRNI